MQYLSKARYGAAQVQEHVLTEFSDLKELEPVVLQTTRGTEMGEMLSPPQPLLEGEYPHLIKVLRRATAEDLARQRELLGPARARSLHLCRGLIQKHHLDMRLVHAEHLLGNEKIYFYYFSETRVDFRQLVRELAHEFQTRIELRQIGPREAAKLLGDMQGCGQPLCCRAFLRKIEPVPMSMARLQVQSIDPSKISGQCGKLKCCLRYEDQVYLELRRNLPERGSRVATENLNGTVVNTDTYNQRVTVQTEDGARTTLALSELRGSQSDPAAGAGAAAPPENPAAAAETARPGARETGDGARGRTSGRWRPGDRPGRPRAERPAPALSQPPVAGQRARPKEQTATQLPQPQANRDSQKAQPRNGTAPPPAPSGAAPATEDAGAEGGEASSGCPGAADCGGNCCNGRPRQP